MLDSIQPKDNSLSRKGTVDNEYTIIISIVTIIVIVVLFLLRFKDEAGVEISLYNKIKLKIWGKNRPPDDDKSSAQPMIIKDTSIKGDLVAGDKYIQVPKNETSISSQKISPLLNVSLYDRERNITKKIISSQNSYLTYANVVYLLALQNNAPANVAKGIFLRLEFYWRGDPPSKTPYFLPLPRTSPWTIEAAKLTHSNPAVLSYSSPEELVAYKSPVTLIAPKLVITEVMLGYFLVKYQISSHDPAAQSRGDLKIQMAYS